MKTLTAKEIAKLQKALKMIKDAEMLIESVKSTNEKIKYHGNANALDARVSGSISILEGYISYYK